MTPTRRGDHRALFWVFFIFTPLQYLLIALGSSPPKFLGSISEIDFYGFYSIMIPVYASLFIPARSAIAGDYKRFLERSAKIQIGLLICVYALSHTPAMLDLTLYTTGTTFAWQGSNVSLLLFFVVIAQLASVFERLWSRIAGRHVIAAKINASRTWEGFLGSMVTTGLVAAALFWATPFLPWEAGVMGAVVTVMACAGTMTMSAIKRDRGVTDTGTLVQGHAGVLDQIDSICFAAPGVLSLDEILFYTMTLPLFDTHAHLNVDTFDDSVDQVVQRAKDAGVEGIAVIGIDLQTSRRACELAAQYPAYLYSVVGIQPNSAAEAQPEDWAKIEELAAMPGVRAIGETGLDCYWDDTPMPIQEDYFDRHMQLCRQTGLPMVIHMRESGDLIVQQLRRQEAIPAGVMHSFTGDMETAKQCLDFGLYVSFAGMVTFKKSTDLRAVAKEVPEDRLLVETDSPYLSPEPLRGRRPNEPARVEHTLRCLADVRGVTPEHLANATTENAKRLFQLP